MHFSINCVDTINTYWLIINLKGKFRPNKIKLYAFLSSVEDKKKDILKNVVSQTVLVTIEIHWVDINTYISNFLKEEKCHAGLEWHEGVLNYNIILLYT